MCERGFGHHGYYGHGHGGSRRTPFAGCCCGPTGRRFPSREEQVKIMEDYKKDLEQELAEVSKHIEDLKK